jgi:hypothetical protein
LRHIGLKDCNKAKPECSKCNQHGLPCYYERPQWWDDKEIKKKKIKEFSKWINSNKNRVIPLKMPHTSPLSMATTATANKKRPAAPEARSISSSLSQLDDRQDSIEVATPPPPKRQRAAQTMRKDSGSPCRSPPQVEKSYSEEVQEDLYGATPERREAPRPAVQPASASISHVMTPASAPHSAHPHVVPLPTRKSKRPPKPRIRDGEMMNWDGFLADGDEDDDECSYGNAQV